MHLSKGCFRQKYDALFVDELPVAGANIPAAVCLLATPRRSDQYKGIRHR